MKMSWWFQGGESVVEDDDAGFGWRKKS